MRPMLVVTTGAHLRRVAYISLQSRLEMLENVVLLAFGNELCPPTLDLEFPKQTSEEVFTNSLRLLFFTSFTSFS